MQDFPPNSRRAARETEPKEPKKIEQVTSADTRQRKRGLGRQFKTAFIQGSSRDAFSYMVEDIVVPTIRDMFVDAMQGGIDRLFNGNRHGPRRGYSTPLINNEVNSRVDYRSQSMGKSRSAPQRMLSRTARSHHDFGELVIQNRREAEEVIDSMFDILSSYGQVSVADLYVLTGIRSDHTDERWGWTNLRGAKAVPLRRQGGFLLDLPPTEELR